jgi:hypothetical protein
VVAGENRGSSVLPGIPSNIDPPRVHNPLIEQPKFYSPLSTHILMGYNGNNDMLDQEPWDPNILSASNWLDQVDLFNTELPFLQGIIVFKKYSSVISQCC